MSRPLVLAIEPDLRQAAIVKRVVKERVQADVVVVDSRDAAVAAIKAAIPDVVLVSMLLSPRDEDELIAHLRTLEGAAHLQTHTIPQLASALGRGDDEDGGLFASFRKKKPASSAPAGCDPDLFADEIRLYLQRAAEKKREAAESGSVTPLASLARRPQEAPAARVDEARAPVASSSWESPFEWRPADRRVAPPPPAAEATVEADSLIPDPSLIAGPESPMPDLESLDLGSPIAVPLPPPPVPHTPAPLSVWARTEPPKKTDAPAADGEFAALFARLGIPAGVASMTYPDGVRIRRVRVRAAKDAQSSLRGAMMLGKRMLAELSGSDARA